MAASLFRRIFVVSNRFKPNIRYYHPSKRKNLGLNAAIFLGVPCVCAVAWRTWRKFKENGEIIPVVQAAQAELAPDRVTTYRELKFQQFASVQYEGIIYMTPQDFLESVTEETPRPRIGRTTLTEHEVESMLKNTPPRKKGSRQLFRSMHNKGIISYTEYLFLLCVLTKPQSGFRIAFNMFDTDGNQIVDKKEFLVEAGFFNK